MRQAIRSFRALEARVRFLGSGFSVICALAIFLSSFFISGTSTPIGELDQSWQIVLEFAAQQRLQFGSEIIFTYGPLGFLFQPHGFGMFPLLRYIFALTFSGVVAFAALNLALRIRRYRQIPLLVLAPCVSLIYEGVGRTGFRLPHRSLCWFPVVGCRIQPFLG